MYYCAQLLTRRERIKESVGLVTAAWADLDGCNPEKLKVKPSIVIESSPERYQALWLFSDLEDPADAEDVSRRIAYAHIDDGADKTGWDLTQLLRIPFTNNHKYRTDTGAPLVRVISTHDGTYSLEDFEGYPPVKQFAYAAIDIPDDDVLEAIDDPETLLENHKHRLMPIVWHLFAEPPDDEADWSKLLWQLEMMLFEGGMSREEAYVICEAAACNKYKRDGRPKMLWKEICRAYSSYETRAKILPVEGVEYTALLSDEERTWAEHQHTFISEYIKWGREQGDAAWQYHQAGGFTILSALLAGRVRLPTSYGLVVPNLWFMILADTTLTRKTTAMDLAIDLLSEVDSDAILATDGSIEGLFTGLSTRPGRPSIFLRDEFSGLLEAISKKDYYAGMAETLTKLYDGKLQKRVLRKEVIEVRDPCLIIFAGGIKSKTLSLLTHEQISSGFLPRFVFVTAESDVSRRRPLGPPTAKSLGDRELLTARLQAMHAHYTASATINVGGHAITAPRTWDAELTPEAWLLYNDVEETMLSDALKSANSEVLMPTFDRLCKSGLKAAVLLAASRRLEDKIVVTAEDLKLAFYYMEGWRNYALEVVNGVGRSVQERQIELVYQAIKRKPGVLRSEIMRTYHLTARDAQFIVDTLDQRAMITKTKKGRTEALYPTTGDV
jgi:hypothetical protein